MTLTQKIVQIAVATLKEFLVLEEFSLKEKDFIVQVARLKRISEPQPKYGVVDNVKFSWCSGWEYEINHSGCKKEFKSEQTNKLYKCSCMCHKEK
jgi:hypothetical protein